MEYQSINIQEIGVRIELCSFAPQGRVAEHHAMLHVQPQGDDFLSQIQRLHRAEAFLRGLDQMQGAVPILKRYFLSDATNQQPLIHQQDSCTISYIQQPPLDGSKVALWIYLQHGTEVTGNADGLNSTVVCHNGYRHVWTMGLTDNQGDSYSQTESLLCRYEETLGQHGATLADNCIRTWFFVRDVDTQYHGLVVARRENFGRQGLTPETHYISSTGIGGNPSDPKALIQLGAYSLTGFLPSQQRYLYALSHLNRTIEYGVTFERGTILEYGDRTHAYISGTASIDNRGNVVHLGDIVQQTQRMWENVQELLREGEMEFQDIMQIIVYLRDIADYDVVSRMFAQKFPNTPYVITLAPVCRPAWLIEMECIAVRETTNSEYREF